MNPNPWLTKIVILVTALALSGLPAMAQATTASTQNQQDPQATQQDSSSTQQPDNGRVDPTAGPKTPVSSDELPDGPQPSEQSEPASQGPATSSSTQGSTPQQTTPQEPLGTAAAQQGRTAGGPGSKPAGMAIAPAKQKQSRSLLIKIGAVVAAGAALGIVYGLSRGTASAPPGAATASNR